MKSRRRCGIDAAGRGGASLLLLAFAWAGGGCSPGGGGTAGDAATTSPGAAVASAPAAAVPDTTRPTFPDAAPGSLQLPNPIRRAVRQPLESWTLAWHAALPTLRLDQFERTGVASFAGVDEGPFAGNVEGADLRLLHLVVPSPDVLLVLDPWLDFELLPAGEGGVVRVVRGLDPGVGLVDLRGRTERRLFDLPPGTRVDGAHWIDEHRVVVLTDEPARGGRRPAFHLVDVRAETATRYAGPVAGGTEAREARLELDRRFLVARPALAFARP
jgi:hypothetical protein